MGIGKTTKNLERWREQGLLSEDQAKRIIEFEKASQRDGTFSRLIIQLGSFSLVLGFLALIGANWNSIPDAVKIIGHAIISLGLATGFYMQRDKHGWARDIFLLLIFGTNLSFIALIGQVFQLQGHPFIAVLIWMAVSTPLLLAYTSTRFVAYAWLVGVAAQNFLLCQWLDQDLKLGAESAAAISTAVAAAYFFFAHVRFTNKHFPLFTDATRYFTTIGIALGVSLMQIAWRTNFDLDSFARVWNHCLSLSITLASYACVIYLSYRKQVVWDFKPTLWFFGAAILGTLAPIAFVHPAIPFVGALCFIAIWVAFGYAAYLAGARGYLDLAIWVISIRLFIVYLELFGTLASTGLGLIIGGVIFLGLGWGARKVQKTLGTLHG